VGQNAKLDFSPSARYNLLCRRFSKKDDEMRLKSRIYPFLLRYFYPEENYNLILNGILDVHHDELAWQI
jgi:hypothetical protein